MAKTRRTVICHCGGDIYEAGRDWPDGDYKAAGVAYWECDNCGRQTPRKTLHRPSNKHRAILAAIAIRDAWKATDDALNALVDAKVIRGGALLVYTSTFNHHLDKLRSGAHLSTWELGYHQRQAREELEKAKQYVAEHQAVPAGGHDHE